MKAFKYVFNILIVCLSLYAIALILSGRGSFAEYLTVIGIEWVLLMVGRPVLRQGTFSKLYKKGTFGSEEAPYGALTLKNLEKELEAIAPDAFVNLAGDVLESQGFEVEYTPDMEACGVDFIAKRNKTVMLVKAVHKNASGGKVDAGAVKLISECMKEYGANSHMIITTGKFSDEAIKSGQKLRTRLIGEPMFIEMTRHAICEMRPKKRVRPFKKLIEE